MFLEAINLTIFGMGFVFIFLTALVFSTKFMSFVALRVSDSASVDTHSSSKDPQQILAEIDEETRLIITQAIKQHIGR